MSSPAKPRRRSLVLQLKNLTQPKMDEGNKSPKSPLSPGGFQQFISTFSGPKDAPPPEKMTAEIEKLQPQNKEKKTDVLCNIELLKEDLILYQEIVNSNILLYRKKLRDLENSLEKENEDESLEGQYNSTVEIKNILSKGMDDKKIKKIVSNLKTVTETFGDWRDEISYENIKCRQTISLKSASDKDINACCFSPDNHYIIIGVTGDSSLQIYSSYTGRLVKSFNNVLEVHSLCISVDGKYLFGGSISTIGVWNLQTFEFVKILSGHSKKVSALDVTPDGKYLISGDANSSDDSHVIVWDLQTFQIYTQIDGLGKVKTVQSLVDSKSFVVEVESISNPTYIMRYQPNGEKLNHFKVERIVSGVLVHEKDLIYGESYPSDESGLSTLNFLTISGKIDNETVEKAYVDLGTGDITKLSKNENGKYFATCSKSSNDVHIWSKDGKEIATLQGHATRVTDVKFSHDSTLVITVTCDGNSFEGEYNEDLCATLKIWN